MPVSKTKDLYLAKSREELNNKVVCIQVTDVKKLVASSKKLFQSASKNYLEGDEELAYLYSMRFFNIMKVLQRNKDYISHKSKYDSELGKSCIKEAIEMAEKLSDSLDHRYKLPYSSLEGAESRPVEINIKKPIVKNLPETIQAAEYKKPNGYVEADGMMSCQRLHCLWKQKSESYLVIDTRSAADFKASYMQLPSVVNVPQKALRPGLTANAAGKAMLESHQMLWSGRDKYDHLIICDLNTEKHPLPDPIKIILDAIEKWDPGREYRCQTPTVLRGGFDLFRLMYPILVTAPFYNPHNPPNQPTAPATLSLNFDYPDLNAAFVSTPSPENTTHFFDNTSTTSLPKINRQRKPQLTLPRSVKNTNLDDVILEPDANKSQQFIDNLNRKSQLMQKEQQLLEESVAAEKDILSTLKQMDNLHQKRQIIPHATYRNSLLETEGKLKHNIEQRQKDSKNAQDKYDQYRQQDEELNVLQQLASSKDQHSTDIQAAKKKEGLLKIKAQEEKRLELVKLLDEMKIERQERQRILQDRNQHEPKDQQMSTLPDKPNRSPTPTLTPLTQWPDPPAAPQNKPTANRSRPNGESYTTRLRTSPTTSPVRGGTNLRRSHSALNVSQFRDNESLEAVMPAFDRTLKPLQSPRRRSINVARQRNFEPKYGHVGAAKTGLKNLGNTCYMNSIIQCLNNTLPLVTYFYNGNYSEDINEDSFQRGDVATEIGAVIRALWCGQYKSIAMWDLKNAIGRYYHPFLGTDQQDSHEFLIKLIDWLHDDLNVIRSKSLPMEEQDFDTMPDFMAAQKVLAEMDKREDSVVRSVMHGLHRSVITCTVCGHRSLTFEPFSVLTFSFVSSSKCSLKEMIHEYYKESQLDYNCARCKRSRGCVRKMDIWKLPPILVIHINRFEHDVLMKKNQNYVDFPLENLNLANYISSNGSPHKNYDLYAVSNHYGTMDGGHYTAFCRSQTSRAWLKFDDNEVYDLSRECVRTSAAYILFYESRRT